MNKLVISFVTLALAVASAGPKMYTVTISQPAAINGTQFKAGDYKLQVEGDKAIFRSGKNVVAEVPAKVESAERKYESTSVSVENTGSQPKIDEIRIGGTKMRILFPVSTGAGQ